MCLITPQWEYWVPDAEVAEVLAAMENRVRVSPEEFFWEDWRLSGRECRATHGYRLGTGDPNKTPYLKLRRPKPERAPLPEPARRACDWCGDVFTPDRRRPGQRHCSKKCARSHLSPLPCSGCGREFMPERSARKFCCVACARRASNAARVPQGRDELLATMWLAGATLPSIAAAVGMTPTSAKRRRRQLGLSPRRKS